MTREKIDLGIVSASLYVSFQVLANVLSTKIALVPWTSWATDGGTIIYPLTFTLRDFVHKSLGKAVARHVVILAGAVSGGAALLFWLVGMLTPDPSWGYQEAYQVILLPVWRITCASIIAQIAAELTDTEIFSAIIKRFGDTSAVFVSNSISLVVDSFIFSAIAFLGVLPMTTLLQIMATNVAIKFVLSLITTPTIKLIPRKVAFEKL